MLNLLKILPLAFCMSSCCTLAVGQIKLSESPYQLWVGFVNAEVQADGTVKASVDSKPSVKTVNRLVLSLDDGYSLKDLEVESLPDLQFVQPTLVQIDGNKLELKLDAKGKFRARAELDYGGKKVVQRFNFSVGGEVPPGPIPPPEPPAPDDIRNDYGLGKVAFANADPATASTFAKAYRAAADSLFAQNGQPLRFISSDDPKFATDPQKNVILWLNNQLASAKPEYKNAVSAAFKESQAKRGAYKKDDWYAAFVEVADALDKVK